MFLVGTDSVDTSLLESGAKTVSKKETFIYFNPSSTIELYDPVTETTWKRIKFAEKPKYDKADRTRDVYGDGYEVSHTKKIRYIDKLTINCMYTGFNTSLRYYESTDCSLMIGIIDDRDPTDAGNWKLIEKEVYRVHIDKVAVNYDGDDTMIEVQCTVLDTEVVEKVTPSTDVTAPTVTVLPIDGATGQIATVSVVWTFSEAINDIYVNSDNFMVIKDSDGVTHSGTLTYDSALYTVTFAHTGAFTAGAKYYTIISKQIRDVAGNKLASTFISDFTVAS